MLIMVLDVGYRDVRTYTEKISTQHAHYLQFRDVLSFSSVDTLNLTLQKNQIKEESVINETNRKHKKKQITDIIAVNIDKAVDIFGGLLKHFAKDPLFSLGSSSFRWSTVSMVKICTAFNK